MPRIYTDDDRAAIREKLLQGAAAALEQKSYKRIPVEKIAASAGIAKGTFYHFFPSKEALFYEILVDIKKRNRAPLLELIDAGIPSREEMIECLMLRFTEMKSIFSYFPPADVQEILAAIPDERKKADNDSVDFASLIGSRIRPLTPAEAETIVGMFNILALAASGRSSFQIAGYEPAMQTYCTALTDFILGNRA